MDDKLVMVQATLKEILQAKETLIFLLQSLSFVTKTKVPTKTRESSRDFSSSDKVSKHDVSLASGKSFGFPKQMHATYRVTKDHN